MCLLSSVIFRYLIFSGIKKTFKVRTPGTSSDIFTRGPACGPSIRPGVYVQRGSQRIARRS